ncbi:MAG: hypothetical protein ACEQSB_00195 [Undibacterium sp.]
MNIKDLTGVPVDPRTAHVPHEFQVNAGSGTLLDYGILDNKASVDSVRKLASLKYVAAGGMNKVSSSAEIASDDCVTGE